MDVRQILLRTCLSSRHLLLALALTLLVGCDNSLRSDKGVSAQGNSIPSASRNGTISGHVIEGDVGLGGEGYVARLVRFDSIKSRSLVDSSEIRSDGAFSFDSVASSEYVVEVWKGGDLKGQTRPFAFVDSVKQEIFVFLVNSIQKRKIDLRLLGAIDSVYVDYRENPGVLVDGKWEVQTLQDTGFVVHTYLSAPKSRWESWFYLLRGGKVVLVNTVDQRALENVQAIDTTSYQAGPHVVALWDFDTLVKGKLLDRSDYRNDLVPSGDASLVPSPRGKALSLKGIASAKGIGSVADSSLWWRRTGMMTYQMRLKVDSSDLGNTILSAWPVLGVVVYPNGKLLIGGQTIKNGVAKWFNLFSQIRIPFDEWIDLTVSCDMDSRQIYVWLGSTPVPLFVMDGWGADQSLLRGDLLDVYELGTTSRNRGVVSFELDELRVSDTLVLGKGYAVQPTNRIVTNMATDSSVILGLTAMGGNIQIDTGMDEFFVGVDSTDSITGRLVLKPRIPSQLIGKTILTAQLTTFDTADETSGDMMMELCPITSAWDEAGDPMDWVGASRDFDPSKLGSPCMKARILENSSGYLRFDLTDLLQSWVSGALPMYGVVIKSVSEDRDMGKWLVSSDLYDGYPVTLEAVYR